MSHAGGWFGALFCGFPRVSGDEPPQMSITWSRTEFSPRERG